MDLFGFSFKFSHLGHGSKADKTRLGNCKICKFGIVLAQKNWIPKGVEKGVNRVNGVNWESRLFSRLGFYAGQPTRERARGFGQGWKAVTLGPRKTKLGPRSPSLLWFSELIRNWVVNVSGFWWAKQHRSRCWRSQKPHRLHHLESDLSRTNLSDRGTVIFVVQREDLRGKVRPSAFHDPKFAEACRRQTQDLWPTLVNPIQWAGMFKMPYVSIMFRCLYYPTC